MSETIIRPATIYPYVTYKNAPAAIDWLRAVLGFEALAVDVQPDGTVRHAELRLGDGIIMLGSGSGGAQGIYIAVSDIEVCYARAVAAGAEMVRDLHDTDYGSRDFGVRDPEGHDWYVGTYRPTP